MIVIEGTIRVADVARARAHMEAMIQSSRAEAGCIVYAYAQDILDPSLVWINERWQSREAFQRHITSEHIKAWRAAWPELGITDRSLRLYDAEPEDL